MTAIDWKTFIGFPVHAYRKSQLKLIPPPSYWLEQDWLPKQIKDRLLIYLDSHSIRAKIKKQGRKESQVILIVIQSFLYPPTIILEDTAKSDNLYSPKKRRIKLTQALDAIDFLKKELPLYLEYVKKGFFGGNREKVIGEYERLQTLLSQLGQVDLAIIRTNLMCLPERTRKGKPPKNIGVNDAIGALGDYFSGSVSSENKRERFTYLIHQILSCFIPKLEIPNVRRVLQSWNNLVLHQPWMPDFYPPRPLQSPRNK